MLRLAVLVPLVGCNALIGVHDFDRGVDALPDADPGPCVADAVTCTAGNNAVQQCASDGSGNSVIAACAGTCTADASGAHCSYLSPQWLPDICDAPATGDFPDASGMKSSDDDIGFCTSTVPQGSSPPICVVRFDRIVISSGTVLTITGTRPVAFVADRELVLGGKIVAAARGEVSGPGGGRLLASGTSPSTTNGGGGAGFATAGAPGGVSMTGSSNGGPIVDPLARAFLGGGDCAAQTTLINQPDGGGGGGGVLFAACRGSANIEASAVVDVGGGGGECQTDNNVMAGFDPSNGGGGGGAGGYVVVQGLHVEVNGAIYANGGGGGGGNAMDNLVCQKGLDGLQDVAAAPGGVGVGMGGSGGAGGYVGGAPEPGIAAGPDCVGGFCGTGGGGGAMGFLHVFTPQGAPPVVTMTKVSAAYAEMTASTR